MATTNASVLDVRGGEDREGAEMQPSDPSTTDGGIDSGHEVHYPRVVAIKRLSSSTQAASKELKSEATSPTRRGLARSPREDVTSECDVTVVEIEGNIGVGKSTAVELLKTWNLGVTVCLETVLEPVDEWMKSDMLRRMYANEINPFHFQVYALVTRYAAMAAGMRRLVAAMRRRHVPGERIRGCLIVERSVQSDPHTFVQIYLPTTDLHAYHLVAKGLERTHCELLSALRVIPSRVVVGLDAPVSELLRRIRARGRTEESDVGEHLLERLHVLHEAYYEFVSSLGVQVVRLPSGTMREEDVARAVLAVIQGRAGE